MTSPPPKRLRSSPPHRLPGLRGRAASLLCASLCLGPLLPRAAAQARPSDIDVKSAYLFNFGKFIRRAPETRPETFDICILGRDAIGPTLEKITQGERIEEQPIRVVLSDRVAEMHGCAIIYVSPSEADHIDRDLAALQSSNALTVSDLPHFLEHGGMIQFLPQGNRIRFSVNLDAVAHTNLQISSELLRVAASVTGSPRKEVRP